jgi:hypothetical protein
MGNEERYSNPPPIITPTEKASVIERITPEHIIEELRHKLMGEIFLNDKRKWIQSPVLMFNAISERGAWDISNLLLSICNQNTALSKLDDKTIRKRAYAITEVAVKMMISNWTSYKITNTAQLNYIADIVYSLTLITLKMSEDRKSVV